MLKSLILSCLQCNPGDFFFKVHGELLRLEFLIDTILNCINYHCIPRKPSRIGRRDRSIMTLGD